MQGKIKKRHHLKRQTATAVNLVAVSHDIDCPVSIGNQRLIRNRDSGNLVAISHDIDCPVSIGNQRLIRNRDSGNLVAISHDIC